MKNRIENKTSVHFDRMANSTLGGIDLLSSDDDPSVSQPLLGKSNNEIAQPSSSRSARSASECPKNNKGGHQKGPRLRARSASPITPENKSLMGRFKKLKDGRGLRNYQYKDAFLQQPIKKNRLPPPGVIDKTREKRRRERKIELEHLKFKPERGRIWQMMSRRRRNWQSNERWKRTRTLVHKLERNVEDYFNTEVGVSIRKIKY